MITKVLRTREDLERLATIAVDPKTQENDAFNYRTVVIKKPWGREYLVLENGEAAVWILHMHRGAKTSLHCHPNKKTALVALAGEVEFSTLTGQYRVSAGEALAIERGVFHSTQALAPDEAIIMEIETPTNKKDLVRLEDSYGRRGQGYEGQSAHLPFEQVVAHFHHDHEKYRVVKDFRDCALELVRCENEQDLRSALASLNAHLIVLVSGRCRRGDNYRMLEVGDCILARDLRDGHAHVTSAGPVELLIVKKKSL